VLNAENSAGSHPHPRYSSNSDGVTDTHTALRPWVMSLESEHCRAGRAGQGSAGEGVVPPSSMHQNSSMDET
jgi:hypothetical protein